MHPRAVCNVVYAHLVRGAQSDEDRQKFDDELYENPGDARAMSLLNRLGV